MMQYFTPERWMKLQSSDAVEVNDAMDSWEAAVGEYQKHLRQMSRKIPSQLKPITTLSLHDWNLIAVAPTKKNHADPQSPALLITLKNNDDFTFLWYMLSQKLRRIDSPEGWPLSKDGIDWLYDEVDFDKTDQKSFIQRILFSDGTTLVVPFSKFNIIRQTKSGRALSHSELMQIA